MPEHLRNKMLIVVEAASSHQAGPLTSDLLEAQPESKVDLATEAPDTSEWMTLIEQIRPLLENLELSDIVETGEGRNRASASLAVAMPFDPYGKVIHC